MTVSMPGPPDKDWAGPRIADDCDKAAASGIPAPPPAKRRLEDASGVLTVAEAPMPAPEPGGGRRVEADAESVARDAGSMRTVAAGGTCSSEFAGSVMYCARSCRSWAFDASRPWTSDMSPLHGVAERRVGV